MRAVRCRSIPASAWAVAGARGLAVANERLKLGPQVSGITLPFRRIAVLAFLGRVGRPASMAIYRLFQNSPLGPEEISRLSEAYERTLRTLSLVDRNDPLTEMIAKKIIEIGQTGVKEPAQISQLAIKGLGIQ